MPRVLAIGLDAASLPLLEELIAAGEAPVVGSLCAAGRLTPLRLRADYRAELAWTELLVGADPRDHGYWGTVGFDPAAYRAVRLGAAPVVPFYGGSGGPVTVAFDVPHATVSPAVRGLQVTAWGAHSAQYPPASAPAGLWTELSERFGPHPAVRSDSEPGWHDERYQALLTDALVTGAQRRAEAMAWLLQRQPDWELALTVFGETHVAGHLLWHGRDRDHPLAGPGPGGTPAARQRLARVYGAVDEAVGRLLTAVGAGPPEVVGQGARGGPGGPDRHGGPVHVVVFAVHDTVTNVSDVAAQFVVPELLAAAEGLPRRVRQPAGRTGPPLRPRPGAPIASLVGRREHGRAAWAATARSLRRRALPLPRRPWWQLDERPRREVDVRAAAPGPRPAPHNEEEFGYQPPVWYRSAWPTMRAFALPTFSDPQVRLNVAGREREGLVSPRHYRLELDRVGELLAASRDGRSGVPLFAGFERPRADAPLEVGGAPADLVAHVAVATDVAWHPQLGRFGPFPFLRTGEHGTAGFVLHVPPPGCASLPLGETAEPGAELAPRHLGPWLLRLLRP